MDKQKEKIKFIDCPTCESKVGAEVLSGISFFDEGPDVTLVVYLLKCPVCSLPICAVSEMEIGGVIDNPEWEEGLLERVWPYPKKNFFDLPTSVKQSLEEAGKCFNVNANLACSVMCRRTLESLCVDLAVSAKSLPDKLKELKTEGIIDGRLAEWGEALRQMGNIGAHASKKHISKQDARDVLDFTIAICDYVYTLTGKYDKFKERQQKKQIQSMSKINPTETHQ
ncbi:MAG: DUF4145 domain-containing protein [Candidatus Nealsonbacteria bacterium]